MRLFVSIAVFGIMLFLPTSVLACNPELEVCDFPSRTEIANRAELAPTITKTRRELGTQWAKPQERLLESGSWINYSCVKGMTITHRGNFNVALCMPDWMRNVPSSASLTFHKVTSVSRRVIYIVMYEDITRYYKYRYR